MTVERSIQDVEKDMEKVAATVEKLAAEERRITDQLSIGQEPAALVEAALSNRSPATSQKNLRSEKRLTEVRAMLGALEAFELRLKLERLSCLESEHAEQVFGRTFYGNDEQFGEMAARAAEQGAELTPAYRGVSPAYPE